MLGSARPRLIFQRLSTPQRIIYTDAAADASMAASIAFYPRDCNAISSIEECRTMTADLARIDIFKKTNLI